MPIFNIEVKLNMTTRANSKKSVEKYIKEIERYDISIYDLVEILEGFHGFDLSLSKITKVKT